MTTRTVVVQLKTDTDATESLSVDTDLYFRTLSEFDSHFLKKLEKTPNCPKTFKGYEVALDKDSDWWIPVEEALVGSWLSKKAASSPSWFIRPVLRIPFRDPVAHEKLQTVADSVLEMRAYIEEEMDEIKQRAGEEIASLRGEVWALKLKLDSLEQAKKKAQASEDLDDIEESFPNGGGVAHSSPRSTSLPKIQLGSNGELKPELFSTFVQFRVPKGTKEADIPHHVASLIDSLDSVPVVYAITSSGSYEPCKYVSEERDQIYRNPMWTKFCIGIQDDEAEDATQTPSVPTLSYSNVIAQTAAEDTPNHSVTTYPKPWVPKGLLKTEENFPSMGKDDVDEICAKTEQMTFTEEFLASQVNTSKTNVWGIPPPVETSEPASSQELPKQTPETPSRAECGSPDSTQYSVASHATVEPTGSPKKQQTGDDYVFVANPEATSKSETTPKSDVESTEKRPDCNVCDKLLGNMYVHCTDCGSYNCCQDCFKAANESHPKEHTFELYIYE
ncbi:hypothetical protein CJU90_3436 [Yarrowia sp. C11]|nr:hypothetical protein CKK34_4883 [Yarrowia sp. E02]KAG5369897.1 hypothetical protein CJU90_3436 [Yarrowia sp. C11]